MENIIQTFTKEEQAIFFVALFLLIFALVMSYAMVQDYRMYLDENYKARYSFCDFIKRERFYIYLLFASIFISLTNLFTNQFNESHVDRMNYGGGKVL